MCGIACYFGNSKHDGLSFVERAKVLLNHRGPDDFGIYSDEDVALLHMRLSILELSELGHQPMASSCGRYQIIFNGEIYNHLELRVKFLPEYKFRGHSDTETIIELFRVLKEQMLKEMVGMWAIVIWDKQDKRLFISRDRYGQKPVYTRFSKSGYWTIASEMKPLMATNEPMVCDATSVVEYLAIGNYGHLGAHTFFKDIFHFPQGCYAWLNKNDTAIEPVKYWVLPEIRPADKVPFDESVKKKLHDLVVEGVLSQTLADVPIGLTLSGGIDSTIVAGILAKHYDKDIHIFSALSPGNKKYDETKYVDAVIKMNTRNNFIVHKKNLNQLSVKDDLEKYINIQEEPFGDASIIAHGFLMGMAAEAGIKVVLNGQGADELFFGYTNMAQAILLTQFKAMQWRTFSDNLKAMRMGKSYMLRTLLQSMMPGLERDLRVKSRIKRRSNITKDLLDGVNEDIIKLYRYDNFYNVWEESVYGVHIPHLVQYDDRNGMANSLEGRMPFLDHRIAEFVATIKPEEFLKNGQRKYILREACREYLPDEVYYRTDKVGFFTPLIDTLYRDSDWVMGHFRKIKLVNNDFHNYLTGCLTEKKLTVADALHIFHLLSVHLWMKKFNVSIL